MITINCFTDGSCYYKVKRGGWAYIAFLPNKELVRNGGLINTTTSRCELIALIRLLEDLKETKFFVKVHIDSQYVVFLLLKNWLRKWIANGSINYKKNSDLLKRIWDLYVNHYQNRLSLIWVRGHISNSTIEADGNFIVDKLCNYKNEFSNIEIDCLT